MMMAGNKPKTRGSLSIGAIALATAIRNNGAMRSLNLANNNLGMPEGWSGPPEHEESSDGVIAVANAIKEMGALGVLTCVNVENNNFPANKKAEIYQMACMNKLNIALRDKSLTELDVSGSGFGAEGAKVVAQYISNNGALSSLNLASNCLCGIDKDGHGAYNASGNANPLYHMYALTHTACPRLGVTALANVIPDMRAMTSLNLASNRLRVEGAKIIAAFLPKCT
jgi:hypothetical protein